MASERLQETTWAVFQLLLNLGLVASVIEQYPDHVQENFDELLGNIKEWSEQRIEEVQMFGEAFDETSQD